MAGAIRIGTGHTPHEFLDDAQGSEISWNRVPLVESQLHPEEDDRNTEAFS